MLRRLAQRIARLFHVTLSATSLRPRKDMPSGPTPIKQIFLLQPANVQSVTETALAVGHAFYGGLSHHGGFKPSELPRLR